jgi:ABC-type multidrug transport system permease subunit
MGTLGALVLKDLRLLWRDRAGLFFIMLAPVVVICVAGFSLANLYGADPTGQTAYDLPLVDEDGGALGARIRERLAAETAVHLQPVASRAEAEDLVRRKAAGAALVIPKGTEAALDAGQPAELVLVVDAVKYLERLNIRVKLLELREELVRERAERVAADARADRERLVERLETLRARTLRVRDTLAASLDQARTARARAEETARAAAAHTRRELEGQIDRAVDATGRRLDAELGPLRAYLDQLAATRRDFEAWLAELKRRAGSHAGDIPPPPAFPEPPPNVSLLAALPRPKIDLPPPPALDLPPVPAMPAIDVPEATVPEVPRAVHADLAVREVNLAGGSTTINTFDQNVPGFSVTFLLLGILLGVSLGLLDERDWGTLDRLRAMPVTVSQVLLGKLSSRFLVGVVQMVTLLVVGLLAFDVSLGPEPWALALPIVGIVFAGTAFGLVVAAVAPSRESVLPLGSIVIVTMAAVGGCWWPIDLEPRWMRQVALAFPTTWAMDAFNDLMIRHRTYEAALLPTAVMVGYGAIYLVLGTTLFRRRLG